VVSAEPQVTAQFPAAQTKPVAHAWPHEPQLAALDCMSTQVPPQLTVPPVHTVVQTPATQACPAITLQAVPQFPQCAGSVWVSVQAAPHWLSGAAQVLPPSLVEVFGLPQARARNARGRATRKEFSGWERTGVS